MISREEIFELARKMWRATSWEGRAGVLIGPLILAGYNLFLLAGDDRGLAHRLYPFGHKLLLLLVVAWIWSRISVRDLLAWLLWMGGTVLAFWSVVEFMLCSLYWDPFDRSAIEAFGSGVRFACSAIVHPVAPFVPWAVFGPAYAYILFKLYRAVRGID